MPAGVLSVDIFSGFLVNEAGIQRSHSILTSATGNEFHVEEKCPVFVLTIYRCKAFLVCLRADHIAGLTSLAGGWSGLPVRQCPRSSGIGDVAPVRLGPIVEPAQGGAPQLLRLPCLGPLPSRPLVAP